MAKTETKKKPVKEYKTNAAQVSTPAQVSAPSPIGPSMGMPAAPAQEEDTSQGNHSGTAYGRQVRHDGSFINADGSHDWVEGSGPQYNWNGEDQKTGLAPIGQDPGSGDALGLPRNSPAYNQASARHQAWQDQNRAAGRTLADLGMTPTRGGGLSNYMRVMSSGVPRGNASAAGPTGPSTLPIGTPVNPDGSPRTPVPSTPITGPGLGTGLTPGANFRDKSNPGPGYAGPGMTTGPVTPSPLAPPGPITPLAGSMGMNPTPANPAIATGAGGNTAAAPQVAPVGSAPIPNPAANMRQPMRTGVGSPTSSLVGNASSRFGNSMGMGIGGGSLYGQRRIY